MKRLGFFAAFLLLFSCAPGCKTSFPKEIETPDAGDDELLLRLGTRHTACLAPELCCPPPEAPQSISFKLPARKP